MSEAEIANQRTPGKPIITSASLAGILALLGLAGIARDMVIIRLTAEAGEFVYWHLSKAFAFYSAIRILIEALYIYMYYDHRRINVHRVIWLSIAVYDVGSFVYSVTNVEGYGPATVSGVLYLLFGVAISIWGFFLAKNKDSSVEEISQDSGNNILQRYLRPGLTSPGLSIALVMGLLPSFVYTYSKYFFTRSDIPLPEVFDNTWFVDYYVAGTVLLLVSSLVIFFSNHNYQIQRLAWVGSILASVLMFMESFDFFMDPSPFTIADPLLPLTVLFLCVRGYCLVYVDEAIHTRDINEPVEDEFGIPVKKFYFLKSPWGITSSRWALLGVILYVPVIYIVFVEMGHALRDKDLVALVVGMPFVFTALSYMRIYHSPATPWRHKGWWWYTFVFNLIVAILSLRTLGFERPEIALLCITSILSIISLIGLNRLHFDEPYERRLG